MADKNEKEKPVPRGKDLRSLSDAINRHFKTNISSVAAESETVDTSYLYKYSTGILSLDKYLGTGGLLGGRILNLFGWEGTGKTLTALTMGAAVQKMQFTPDSLNPTGEGRVAFLDAEGTFSYSMAKSVGIDTEKLLLFRSTPEKILCGEDYFALLSILVQNGIEFIIVDSAPALTPGSRLTATVGQGQKATQAQMMAEGLQQVTTLLNAFQRSVVVFINQIRMKPMVMFGPTEDSTGGSALKFFASYALEVKKTQDIIKKVPNGRGGFQEERIGVSIKALLEKNKTASIPVAPITYDVYFQTVTDENGLNYSAGVDIFKDLVGTGLDTGVIKQSGAWFQFGDVKAQGKEDFIEALRGAGDPILQQIRQEVLTKV